MDFSFDDLRDPILERLGLAAIFGLTVAQLFDFIKELCEKIHTAKVEANREHTRAGEPQLRRDESGLSSAIKNVDTSLISSNNDLSTLPTTAQVLLETEEWRAKLWGWLTSLPDFVVGPEGEGNRLSLAETEALPLPPLDENMLDSDDDVGVFHTRSRHKKKAALSLQQNTNLDLNLDPTATTDSGNSEQPQKLTIQPRVFASHKKIWRTITGHTCDWDKLPLSEFEVLCAISAAGKDGVDQPSLIKITGQDKRSIPKRTYALETKGYIEKRPIVVPKWNTSFLLHKKFVDEQIADGTHYSLKMDIPISTADIDLVPGSEFWTGSVIWEDAMVQRTIDLVRTWGAIIYDDAKTKMGIIDKKWHMKVFSKRIRTLCGLGVIEKGNFAMPGSSRIFHGVLKFLREPTDDEWKTLVRRSVRELPTNTKSPAPSKTKPPRKSERGPRRRNFNDEDDVGLALDLDNDGDDDDGADNGTPQPEDGHDIIKSHEEPQTTDIQGLRSGTDLKDAEMPDNSDALPRAYSGEHPRDLPVSVDIEMPDATQDYVAEMSLAVSAGHTTVGDESSKSSQLLPSIAATNDVHDLHPHAQKSTSTDVPKPPTRRGRPPKAKPPQPSSITTVSDLPNVHPPAGEHSSEQQGTNEASPLSDQVPATDTSVDVSTTIKRRGRPPKRKLPQLLPSETTTSDVPDVNPQAESASPVQQEMNQISTASAQDAQASTFASPPQVSKRRGRPPAHKYSESGTDFLDPPRAAIFISYQDHQRVDGVSGVYINPLGYKYSTTDDDVLVAVFKTNLLKNWVPKTVHDTVDTPVAEHQQTISDVPLGDDSNATVCTPLAEHLLQLPQNNFSAVTAPMAHQAPVFMSQTPISSTAHENSLESAYMLPFDKPILPIRNSQGNPASAIGVVPSEAPADSLTLYTSVISDQSSSLMPSEIAAGAEELENLLNSASDLELPEDSGFILVVLNQTPGKLGLADDKNRVVFFAAETTQVTNPALEIKTSTLSEYPSVVKSTSFSGDFYIKANGQLYAFTISVADEAWDAANILRAKIVTTLLAQGFQESKKIPPANTVKNGGKFYECEHCHKRWKNDNGLLYHHTKSRSTCNPNWDPSEVNQPLRSVSQKPNTDETGQELRSRRSERHSNSFSRGTSQVNDRQVGGELDDIFGQDTKRKAREISVGDSDFVPDEADKPTSKKRRLTVPHRQESSKASPKRKLKTSNLQGGANAEMDVDMDIDMDTDVDSVVEPKPTKRKKPSKAKGAPVPNSHQSLKEIIVYLVDANGGVFPGDPRSLWAAVAAESRKRHPNIPFPDFTKVPAALKSLLDGRRVKKLTYSFKSTGGLMAKIVIVVKRAAEDDSDVIDRMKSLLMNAYPNRYIPEQFKPSDSMMAELNRLEEERVQRKNQVGVLSNAYYMAKAVEEPPRPVSRARSGSEAFSYQFFSDRDSGKEDEDGEGEEEDRTNDGGIGRVSIAEKSEEAHHSAAEVIDDEEEDLYIETSWLQDPASGKWQIPATGEPRTGEQRKRDSFRKPYFRKTRLPEVITYMQSEGDPTWSAQPYGHGARPIYSRPSRRVEGNPATDVRLRRLQDGHRPIIEPRSKMITPVRPSKLLSRLFATSYISTHDQFLQAAKEQELEMASAHGGKKRRTTRASRKPMSHHRSIASKPLPVIVPPTLPQSSATFTFLPPNTDLDDHLIDKAAGSMEGVVLDQPLVSGVFAFDDSSYQTPLSVSNITFANAKTIHKIQGQYHNISISEFEENPCSYSLDEPVISQAFFLDQLFPKSLADILSTKEARIAKEPTKKREKTLNLEYVSLSEQIDAVKDWELANESLLSQGPVASEIGNAINHTIKVLKYAQKPFRTRTYWETSQALTWFNPPCESENDYNSEDDRLYSQGVKCRRQEIKPKTYTKIKHFKTRKLTHLKGDFETLDDPTGVPVLDLVDAAAGRKGRKFRMSSDEENRFVIAHIAIGTVAGGLSKITDSILVARMFPMYTLNKIRQLWCKIRKCRGKELPIIEAKFQEAFLKGYEDGELPVLDYDDLISYDWSYIIDWYMRKYPVVSGGALPGGLPSTRSALLAAYKVEDMQPTENWRDTFLVKNHAASKVKRHLVAAQDQLTVPIHPEYSGTRKIDAAGVAKSVVKAAIATPGETYNQHVAEAALEKIGDAAVTKARDELLKDSSIKHKYRGRAVPRQPYHMTEAFSKPLVRESIKASNWQEALVYKQQLDAAFRKGESVRIEYQESDGAFMCITNLVAHDRIRLIQSKVPISKYGLLVNGYETNSIDKNQLLFALEIEKTESYLYNEDILSSTAGKLAAPRAIGSEIPAWFDINGDLIPDFWVKAQKGLLSALALRSGANIEELLRIFKLSLMDWEMKLLLEWGLRNGAVVEIGKGLEGWSAGEWWWLLPSLGMGV